MRWIIASQKVILNVAHSPLVVPCRLRGKVNIKHPRPVHMPRRILEAVTKPVYLEQLDDPTKTCSILKYEKQKSLSPSITIATTQMNMYEQFLIREVRKVLDANQMISVVQPESLDGRKRTSIANILFNKSFSISFFPPDVLRKSVEGTKWQCMGILMHGPTALVVSKTPQVKELFNVLKKIPELILLGGVVEDRLLTREGLLCYSKMPSLAEQYGQLVAILTSPLSTTHRLLGSQQSSLSQSLKHHSDQQAADVSANTDAKPSSDT